mgnify:CR=1 FL=1
MKKIRVILFLMLSICILVSCGNDKNTTEENKKSEKSDYNGIKEIDFSNKDNEKLKKFLAFYTSNKDKYMYYSSALEEYTLMFGYDYLYEVYLISFINGENEFQADEEKVNSFKSSLVTFDERFGNVYEQFKNLIPLIKGELNKGIDKNGNGIDEKYKEFIELAEEKTKIIDEIKQYYRSNEYKSDNFSKGRELNDKYLANYKETKEKYREVYNLFLDTDIVLFNNDIKSSKDKNSLAKMDLIKARLLLKMFTKELYASSFQFEFIKAGTAININNRDYIDNLKNIQQALDKTIQDMEKLDEKTIEKENFNPTKYKEIIAEMKNLSIYLKEIIIRFEKTDYKEIMQIITEFTIRNYLIERVIETL